MTPAQVNELSIFQFAAACEGFAKAHNPDAEKELSDAEKEDLWAWIQTRH